MDQQWRSMPPSPPICPVCSISHFPFCSHHHNPYPPPPPPYQQPPPPRYPYPGYPQPDPYYQSNPPPPSYYPPRPNNTLHTNPNFDHNQGFAPSVYDYSNIKSNNYGFVAGSEFDRSYKRPRVDDFGGSPQGRVLPEDERRLKLIRDHGGVGLDFDKVHSNFDNLRNREVGSVNRSNNDARDLHSPFQPDHQVPQRPNSMPDYMRPDYLSSCGGSKLHEVGGYLPEHRGFGGQPPPPPPPPPLPLSPPPPYPVASPVSAISDYKTYPLPPNTSFSLFPFRPNSLETNSYSHNKMRSRGTAGFASEEWQSSSRQYQGDGQAFSQKQLSPEKATVVDASHLFKPPYRATRPDHFVVILRGLPGSGKSYLAKLMRDLEVENGGTAPRIHSMDDYFMTEVEKAEDSDASKSSGSGRGKKPIVKRVMEYCYEPEMEEAYRDSMLKAFKKTLDEGVFTFVIVDDRNLRVADFAQFWAIAKRSGYEVYILEATYKDPAGCAARNVHGFTLEEIQNMSAQWEEAPSFYLHLDIKTLFGGDDLKESGIQEVDMDTEEGDSQNDLSGLQEKRQEKALITPAESDSVPDCKLCDNEEDHPTEGVKELGKSKWSHELDEKNTEESENIKGNLSALSGLVQAYKKQGKSVRWSDQEEDTGFSIRAAKRANVLSLVIGPGSGYNLKSNPLADEESIRSGQNSGKPRRSAFQDRLRAEKESFKAIFDKRRQRIGGLHLDEE